MGLEFVDGILPDATLQVLGNTQVFYQNLTNQVLDANTFLPYDPQQVRLTTFDGRVFDLDLNSGLTRIEDRNGNKLFINWLFAKFEARV